MTSENQLILTKAVLEAFIILASADLKQEKILLNTLVREERKKAVAILMQRMIGYKHTVVCQHELLAGLLPADDVVAEAMVLFIEAQLLARKKYREKAATKIVPKPEQPQSQPQPQPKQPESKPRARRRTPEPAAA